jgi:hypothetical protein
MFWAWRGLPQRRGRRRRSGDTRVDKIINTGMASHPLNYVIVFTMLALGVMFLHLLQPTMQQIASHTARVPN